MVQIKTAFLQLLRPVMITTIIP